MDPLLPGAVDSIVTGLCERGRAFLPRAVDEEWWHAFDEEMRAMWTSGGFRPARVGRGPASEVRPEIRGDWVRWIDPTDPTAREAEYLNAMEDLRLAINQSLFLGLFSFEAHFARYPPGTGYKRHLDRFREASHRIVTCILYLNEDWHDEDGGALRVWPEPDDLSRYEDVLPLGGSLVVFFADRFWHEVRPAARERQSVTGWFTRS